MSAEAAFPLDAEQIVRLTAAVLYEVKDYHDGVSLDHLTLVLADLVGVALPVEVVTVRGRDERRLLRYGETTVSSGSSLQPFSTRGDQADV